MITAHAHAHTGNPVQVVLLTAVTLAIMLGTAYLIGRSRRPPRPAAPLHPRPPSPQPGPERQPYEPGVFTISPGIPHDERNPQ